MLENVKIKRILVIGPGVSSVELLNKSFKISSDIFTLGLHRIFPLYNNNTGLKLDFWTWGDPHGAVEGLRIFEKMKPEDRPKIILPYWMENLNLFYKHSGTSPIKSAPPGDREIYHKVIESIKGTEELILIDNAVTTKLLPSNHEVFKNPEKRFKGENTYFNSAPFDGVHSGSNWTSENKLTAIILPICHYLGAEEVYSIGFDNKGLGIKRNLPVPFNDKIKKKYMLWIDTWKEYHNMKIYNLSPEKYSPNHTFMETVSIDTILNK